MSIDVYGVYLITKLLLVHKTSYTSLLPSSIYLIFYAKVAKLKNVRKKRKKKVATKKSIEKIAIKLRILEANSI